MIKMLFFFTMDLCLLCSWEASRVPCSQCPKRTAPARRDQNLEVAQQVPLCGSKEVGDRRPVGLGMGRFPSKINANKIRYSRRNVGPESIASDTHESLDGDVLSFSSTINVSTSEPTSNVGIKIVIAELRGNVSFTHLSQGYRGKRYETMVVYDVYMHTFLNIWKHKEQNI